MINIAPTTSFAAALVLFALRKSTLPLRATGRQDFNLTIQKFTHDMLTSQEDTKVTSHILSFFGPWSNASPNLQCLHERGVIQLFKESSEATLDKLARKGIGDSKGGYRWELCMRYLVGAWDKDRVPLVTTIEIQIPRPDFRF